MVGCNMWSGYEADRERDAERTGADCPLWCDTNFTKEGSTTYTADDLAEAIIQEGGDIRFCVLTGGEPFLQADAELIQGLHAAGFQVAIETNGTIRVADAFHDDEQDEIVAPDWIVCSPKLPAEQLTLEYFDELKLVVPDYQPAAYAAFAERGRVHNLGGREKQLLWLQPEDGPRLDAARDLAVDLALEYPDWRVSVQTHKMLNIA
jgi:organic radical activating enzyme